MPDEPKPTVGERIVGGLKQFAEQLEASEPIQYRCTGCGRLTRSPILKRGEPRCDDCREKRLLDKLPLLVCTSSGKRLTSEQLDRLAETVRRNL